MKKLKLLSFTIALMLSCGFAAMGQSLGISGSVRETGGAPIPGASVIVEGTATGTVTDAEGKFTLQVPGED